MSSAFPERNMEKKSKAEIKLFNLVGSNFSSSGSLPSSIPKETKNAFVASAAIAAASGADYDVGMDLENKVL